MAKGIAKLPRTRGRKNVRSPSMLGIGIGSEPFPVISPRPGMGSQAGKRVSMTMKNSSRRSRRKAK